MRAFIVSLGMKVWASVNNDWEILVDEDKGLKLEMDAG